MRALPSKCKQMRKTNLIDHVAEATKGTKKETEELIDAVLASITGALVKREKIDLRGFNKLTETSTTLFHL